MVYVLWYIYIGHQHGTNFAQEVESIQAMMEVKCLGFHQKPSETTGVLPR
jgi:hypothetical protein